MRSYKKIDFFYDPFYPVIFFQLKKNLNRKRLKKKFHVENFKLAAIFGLTKLPRLFENSNKAIFRKKKNLYQNWSPILLQMFPYLNY